MPNQPFQLPRIYPITDSHLSGLTHAEQVRQLIAGGAEIVQIREKKASSASFYDSVVLALKASKDKGVHIVVNDRVDIAIAAGADGVHLGQDDLSPELARKLLGSRKIIGYSTHSVEQAQAAIELPVDYIAIGPIFPTSTKENPDQVVGLKGIQEVRKAIGEFPLVAIGGIDMSNVISVFEAGATTAAIVSGLLSDPDLISERTSQILRMIG